LLILLLVVPGVATVTYRLRYDPLAAEVTADRVLVEKSRRRLTLYHEDVVLKRYAVALGREPVGAKRFEGDGKTPEGQYVIDRRKKDSAYHLALHVSYPDRADRDRATAEGRPAGGDIMIHGIRNGLGFLGPVHRVYDWTQGCIALTNAEIEELWRAVPDGTPIEIRP
jgi:murein L,D-transpeptidase YafK